MKIEIEVAELLSRVVTVEANNIDDAVSIVQNMYRDENIVLDYSDFDGTVSIEAIDKK